MTELIKITTNEQGFNVVSARELYEYLQASERFSTWFARQIQYGFEENKDFTSVKSLTLVNNGAERELQDYALIIDAAKEISMIQKSEKGKEARQYFIECEKELTKPKDIFEVLFDSIKIIKEQSEKLKVIDNKLIELESKQITIDTNYYTVSGYCNLKKIKCDASAANLLGRRCSKLSKELDYHIGKSYDSKYGEVNTYHLEVLNELIK
jgi:phage anti-repressor protein